MGQLGTWRHSEDEVIDFLVSEALVFRVREFEKAQKKKQDTKADHDKFKRFED